MVRATADPSSPHASVFVTPSRGIALQWRSAAGGTTMNFAVAGSAPQWIKLDRSGDSVTAWYSSDGTGWTSLDTISVTLPQNALVGLAVASHDDTQTATATIDGVSVTAAAPPPSSALPAPWTDQDIGAVGVAGTATFDSASSTFTIDGSGSDIWGTADAFHFVSQPWTGDGAIDAGGRGG